MNILITGANGFIGSNLMTMLADIPNAKLFAGTRDTIDLYSSKSVREYIEKNEITKIVHCAIEGGRRNVIDPPDIVYRNILMAQNLIQCQEEKDTFINIASGAEFDLKEDIYKEDERALGYRIPTDYYGFSKNMIARNVLGYHNGINLRVFGCFYHNEKSDRFIKTNILRYLKDEPIIIFQDKYMDFIYMEDLAKVIKYLLIKTEKFRLEHFDKDINMSYRVSYTLRQIATMINSLDWKHHSKIIVEKEGMANSYCGKGYNFSVVSSDMEIKGFEKGILEYYKKLNPDA
jgi:dTDP-4-dehydrorhamnose reductase